MRFRSIICLLAIFALCSTSHALTVPNELGIDIRLAGLDGPLSGDYDVTASITVGSGAYQIWQEGYPNSEFDNGELVILLGDEGRGVLMEDIPDMLENGWTSWEDVPTPSFTTVLDPQYFRLDDVQIWVHVLGASVEIPVNQIPYAYQSLLSTRTQSLESSSLFTLDEDNSRIGIGESSPLATLDVDGGIRITDEGIDSEGSLYWNEDEKLAYVYRDDKWVDLTYEMDSVIEHSKWRESSLQTYIAADPFYDFVGIGAIDTDYRLNVSGNMLVQGGMIVTGDMQVASRVNVSETPSNSFGYSNVYFLDSDGSAYINELSLQDSYWEYDMILVSGVITGNADGLSSVPYSAFEAKFPLGKLETLSAQSKHIKNRSIESNHIQDRIISSENLVSDILDSEQITANVFDTQDIVDGSLSYAHLGADQLVLVDVLDGQIGTDKFEDGAIGNGQLADGAISSDKILAATLTLDDFEDQFITSRIIQDESITSAHILDGTLTKDDFASEFSVTVGGTGVTSLSNGAIVQYTGSGLETNTNELQWDWDQEFLGVNIGLPENHLHLYDTDAMLRVDSSNSPVLQLTSPDSDWEFSLDSSGTLAFENTSVSPLTPQLELSASGQIGDGDERVNLSGAIGFETSAGTTVNGVIYYDGSDFIAVHDGSSETIAGVGDFSGKSYGEAIQTQGLFAAVSGGQAQEVQGAYSLALSGQNQSIKGPHLSVAGGRNQALSGTYSTSVSGQENTIDAHYSVLLSSSGQSGTMDYALVGLSDQSDIDAQFAVLAGQSQSLHGDFSGIVGGRDSSIQGDNNLILSGASHQLSAEHSLVLGGDSHTLSGAYAWVAGGKDNALMGTHSSILGGVAQHLVGDHSSILGGMDNRLIGDQSLVLGGSQQELSGDRSLILAGKKQVLSGSKQSILSGSSNKLHGSYALLLGGHANEVIGHHSTIASGAEQTVHGDWSLISSGSNNSVNAEHSAVLGGYANKVLSDNSSVVSGIGNTVSAEHSVVAAGEFNTVGEDYSVVLAGKNNHATGYASSVAGGQGNLASGDYSLALGKNAIATHKGSFVFSDASSEQAFASTADNRFEVQASGGIAFYTGENKLGLALYPNSGTWSLMSDRNRKHRFKAVDYSKILSAFSDLDIDTWVYRSKPSVRHMGPVAQDFYAAFGLGLDEFHIDSVDADGVAFALIQGLAKQVQDYEQDIRLQRERKQAYQAELDTLKEWHARLLRSEVSVDMSTSSEFSLSYQWLFTVLLGFGVGIAIYRIRRR